MAVENNKFHHAVFLRKDLWTEKSPKKYIKIFKIQTKAYNYKAKLEMHIECIREPKLHKDCHTKHKVGSSFGATCCIPTGPNGP